MAIKNLSADYNCSDLSHVDWPQISELGYKLIFLDIDNTLAKHGSDQPDQYAVNVVAEIGLAGIQAVVLSNAAGDRGERYAKALGVPGIGQAGKPRPDKISQKLRSFACPPDQAMLIGDQLLTDVWAAKRAGITAVKVKPRFRQELWFVRLKRGIELLLRPFVDLGKSLPTRDPDQN